MYNFNNLLHLNWFNGTLSVFSFISCKVILLTKLLLLLNTISSFLFFFCIYNINKMTVKQRIGGLVLVAGTIALYIFRFTHEYIYIYMRVCV